MKKILLFVIIFILGGGSYAILNPFLSSFIQKKPLEETASTTVKKDVSQETKEQIVPTETTQKPEPQIDQTGGIHDGPFPIVDASGKKTNATVQIIRSPEETLLQFEGEALKHSDDALIYFATDQTATKFFSIGNAKLNEDVLIYGMPIDVNMNMYRYILIYNPTTKKTEYYAEI